MKFNSSPSLCTNKFFHVLMKPEHRLWRTVQDLAPTPFSFSSAKPTSWPPHQHQKLPVLFSEICCWKQPIYSLRQTVLNSSSRELTAGTSSCQNINSIPKPHKEGMRTELLRGETDIGGIKAYTQSDYSTCRTGLVGGFLLFLASKWLQASFNTDS